MNESIELYLYSCHGNSSLQSNYCLGLLATKKLHSDFVELQGFSSKLSSELITISFTFLDCLFASTRILGDLSRISCFILSSLSQISTRKSYQAHLDRVTTGMDTFHSRDLIRCIPSTRFSHAFVYNEIHATPNDSSLSLSFFPDLYLFPLRRGTDKINLHDFLESIDQFRDCFLQRLPRQGSLLNQNAYSDTISIQACGLSAEYSYANSTTNDAFSSFVEQYTLEPFVTLKSLFNTTTNGLAGEQSQRVFKMHENTLLRSTVLSFVLALTSFLTSHNTSSLQPYHIAKDKVDILLPNSSIKALLKASFFKGCASEVIDFYLDRLYTVSSTLTCLFGPLFFPIYNDQNHSKYTLQDHERNSRKYSPPCFPLSAHRQIATAISESSDGRLLHAVSLLTKIFTNRIAYTRHGHHESVIILGLDWSRNNYAFDYALKKSYQEHFEAMGHFLELPFLPLAMCIPMSLSVRERTEIITIFGNFVFTSMNQYINCVSAAMKFLYDGRNLYTKVQFIPLELLFFATDCLASDGFVSLCKQGFAITEHIYDIVSIAIVGKRLLYNCSHTDADGYAMDYELLSSLLTHASNIDHHESYNRIVVSSNSRITLHRRYNFDDELGKANSTSLAVSPALKDFISKQRGPFNMGDAAVTSVSGNIQRLEFLGDAVISHIFMTRIAHFDMGLTVGELSQLKAIILSNSIFERVVNTHNMMKFLKISTSIADAAGVKYRADFLESFFGCGLLCSSGLEFVDFLFSMAFINEKYIPDMLAHSPVSIASRTVPSVTPCEELSAVFFGIYKNIFQTPSVMSTAKDIGSSMRKKCPLLFVSQNDELVRLYSENKYEEYVDVIRGLWLSSYLMNLTDRSKNPVLLYSHGLVSSITTLFTNAEMEKVCQLNEFMLDPIDSEMMELCDASEDIAVPADVIKLLTQLYIPIEKDRINKLIVALFRALCQATNDKLEIIGDSFLKYVSSLYLFVSFPYENEGILTLCRVSIENNNNLGLVLQSHLPSAANYVCRYHSRINESAKVFGDTMEAIIGALLLTCGENMCKDFIYRVILINSPRHDPYHVYRNANVKTKLNIIATKLWCETKLKNSAKVILVNSVLNKQTHSEVFLSITSSENRRKISVADAIARSRREAEKKVLRKSVAILHGLVEYSEEHHIELTVDAITELLVRS